MIDNINNPNNQIQPDLSDKIKHKNCEPEILRKMSLRFCANLNFLFAELSDNLLDRVKAAATAGFRGIEFGYPNASALEHIQQTKEESGVEVVLLNISLEGGPEYNLGSASVPGGEEIFKRNLDDSIKLAQKLDCKKIHLMAGRKTNRSEAEHLSTYLKNLTFASKRLSEAQIIGVIEPINKQAIPDYFLNSYETAIKVLDEVSSPNLKLMVDIFHLQRIRGNIWYSLNELKPYIGHIQIAQVPHRHEPDVVGELDFNYVFQAIRDIGYNDWIGCEYKPKGSTAEGLRWLSKYGLKL